MNFRYTGDAVIKLLLLGGKTLVAVIYCAIVMIDDVNDDS
jgi:hypothetical protein